MTEFFLVILFGGLGSGSRYFLGKSVPSDPAYLGLGTFLVNCIGCFVIGVVWMLLLKNNLEQSSVRVLLLTGFLGGFTTFSAFSLDTILLLQNGSIGLGVINLLLQPVCGALLTYCGVKAVQLLC